MIIFPHYNFEMWAVESRLLTIGKPELFNIYVKNSGNMEDSYNISFEKIAQDQSLNDVSHLVDVFIPSDEIALIEPGKMGNTFATIIASGPINRGNVTFNITSESIPSISFKTSIGIKTGYPMTLPEFGFLGIVKILVLASLLSLISYFREGR